MSDVHGEHQLNGGGYMGKNRKKKGIQIIIVLIAVTITVVVIASKADKRKPDTDRQSNYVVQASNDETIIYDKCNTPCITDKSGPGGSKEDLIKPASGTTAEPEKDVVTMAPSVTQTIESNKSGDKADEIVPSGQDGITPEVKTTAVVDNNKEAEEKTSMPTPEIKVNTPVPSPLADTPVPTVKSVSPTPTVKTITPTLTIKVNTPVPTEKVIIPTQRASTTTPTIKTSTPTPTETVHVCSAFEQISKTVMVPMQIDTIDRGPYDEEIVTDQVYWCMSCGKSEYDLGFRTYNMETGETIWEDYNGFCEHCEYCWIKTGKGGNWNDFKQQVINVVHHDHCYGKDVIPEHEEVVNGKKCTICGKEYW